MPPIQGRLYTVSQCLVARINNLFPGGESPVWTVDVSESLDLNSFTESTRWTGFLCNPVDQFHKLFLDQIRGLSELRHELRVARRLARQVREDGPAGVAFHSLLRKVVNAPWLEYHDQRWDAQRRFHGDDDSQIYEPFQFHVLPPCVELVRQMGVVAIEFPVDGPPASKTKAAKGDQKRNKGRQEYSDTASQAAAFLELTLICPSEAEAARRLISRLNLGVEPASFIRKVKRWQDRHNRAA